MHDPTSRFRSDIEGLRALAVLLVVAAHSGVPGLAGGYIGVDVFFVISGFLITRLLDTECRRSGSIDVAGFYARRMRRLLPAFALVLLFVLAAIRVVYAPIEQPRMLASAFAATLYFSNVHYALEATNYMAPVAKLDPLLHTWSLGVEEQFYLVWPFLLLGIAWLARRNQGRLSVQSLVLGGLLLASLLYCLSLTLTRQPLAFFLPFTRAWEFAAGAVVALFGQRWLASGPLARLLARPLAAQALGLAALALVLAPAALLTPESPFPGWRALLPVTGAALLILLVPATPSAVAGRLLALPPLQWLGRISYGWYLWHWPLLVVGREVLPAHGLATELALAGLGLALAQVSYMLVEHPLRSGPLLQRKAVALGMGLVLAAGSVAAIQGLAGSAQALADSPRFERLRASESDVPLLYQYDCDRWFYDASVVECVGGDPEGKRTAVLLGDSHAGQWYSALDATFRARGWKLVVMTKSACPIIDEDFFYPRIGRVFTECRLWKRGALARIQALRPDVLIVSNSENYVFSQADWTPGLRRLLGPLAAASGHLVVVRDTPNPGFSTPSCLARQEWNPTFSLRDCSFEPTQSQSPAILASYQAVARQLPNMHIVDMTAQICSQSPCPVKEGRIVKYRDANHLSDTFVKHLTAPLEAALVATGSL